MINFLEITNFQPHLYTYMEFSPGLNIIKGTSHGGKSSIIRSLRWVIRNKPTGDAFRSWFSKDKDITSVSVGLEDDSFVTRERSKSKNFYTTHIDRYEAIRSDVPEEVQNVLQMEDVNIQSQRDRYFLLESSPGEVARKLNDAAGLDIIDKTTTNIKSIIRTTEKSIEFTEKNLTETKAKLESYEDLIKIEPMIQSVEDKFKRRGSLTYQKTRLTALLDSIKIERKVIGQIKKWLEVEQSYLQMKEKLERLKSLEQNRKRIKTLLDSILQEKSYIEKCGVLLSLKDKHTRATQLVNAHIKLSERRTKLQSLVSIIKKTRSVIRVAENERNHKGEVYDRLLQKLEICPFCRRKIKSKKRLVE